MKFLLLAIIVFMIVGIQSLHDAIEREESHPILFYGFVMGLLLTMLGIFF